jgi:hypothetical protein
MDNSREARFKRSYRQRFVAIAAQTKRCYFIGCNKTPIKAHSISNARILQKLSENGEVMYMNAEFAAAGELIKTGRGKATAFSGFCDDHDKIFLPVDTQDYQPGNEEHNYLFAMRAAAKEYNTREAVSAMIADTLENPDSKHAVEFPLKPEAVEAFREYERVHDIGTADIRDVRRVFNNTFRNRKLNVVDTAVIEVSNELPIAASAMFQMELDEKGNIINDVSSTDAALKGKMKPCFMTIFPQEGKTYCLLSYFRKDRKSYAFLKSLNERSELEKEVIISNLLTSYTENFAANPPYWNGLDAQLKEKYMKLFGSSFKTEYAPLVRDKEYNLFPA